MIRFLFLLCNKLNILHHYSPYDVIDNLLFSVFMRIVGSSQKLCWRIGLLEKVKNKTDNFTKDM